MLRPWHIIYHVLVRSRDISIKCSLVVRFPVILTDYCGARFQICVPIEQMQAKQFVVFDAFLECVVFFIGMFQ